MHFVGNRAIILGDGTASLQLVYNPGFTALSVFLPIVFLFAGLSLVELRQSTERYFWPFLIGSGVIAGLAITGMHYVGNFGIDNYKLSFPAGYIVGAAAIAIVSSFGALALFYYFREKWVNSLPRRLGCATILAGAVCGMHWVASVGTTYTLRAEFHGGEINRNINLIIALVCSLLACVVCLIFAFLTQRHKKQLADRAQHVVLASAIFDHEGRILVTQEGLPPCRKVTKQFNQKSFDDEFNLAHPVYQWIYRVTYNWEAVLQFVPAMKSHLRLLGAMRERGSRTSTSGSLSTSDDFEHDNDYSILFREYFCVAADELATSIGVPLAKLGVLYNGIMTTGSISSDFQKKRGSKDVEQGLHHPILFGNGQLLFLVRSADKSEAAELTAGGYRFAQPEYVSEIIARAMKVSHSEIIETIDKLRDYAEPREPLASGGSYIACFAIRAALKGSGNRSWDILVPSDHAGDLPSVQLSDLPLTHSQLNRLAKLDGLSVTQCQMYLNNMSFDLADSSEKSFVEHLQDQITRLTKLVPEDFFHGAVFSATPVPAPGLGDDRDSSPPLIYAFSVIPDVHMSSIRSHNNIVKYTPLTFFQCEQRVYKHAPDHAILAQKIHREFGTILSRKEVADQARRTSKFNSKKGTPQDGSGHSSPRLKHLSIPALRGSKTGSPPTRSGNASPREREASIDGAIAAVAPPPRKPSTVTATATYSPKMSRPQPAFGGIMVSSDTKIEVSESDMEKPKPEDMGVTAQASVVANESPTYVDELFKITSTRFRNR
jgi:NO-binding membrane sensor protein with MHYT domain